MQTSWFLMKPAHQDHFCFNPHSESILVMKLHQWTCWNQTLILCSRYGPYCCKVQVSFQQILKNSLSLQIHVYYYSSALKKEGLHVYRIQIVCHSIWPFVVRLNFVSAQYLENKYIDLPQILYMH